jgi:hypothetical protein
MDVTTMPCRAAFATKNCRGPVRPERDYAVVDGLSSLPSDSVNIPGVGLWPAGFETARRSSRLFEFDETV